MVTGLDRAIEGGILGLLLFAPLPFGSVLPWAQAALEGTIALLVGLWLVRMFASGELTLRWTPLLGPGIAMMGLLAVQCLRPTGSTSPYATWTGARLYLAYVGLLLVLAHHLVTRARIVRLLGVLIGWGVVLTLVGRLHQAQGQAGFLWWTVDRHADLTRFTSTFINPNHQALYFAVLLFLAVGWFLGSRRVLRTSGPEGIQAGWPAPVPLVCLGGAIVVLAGALVLTGSRGGLVSAGVGVLVVGALLRHDRMRRGAFVALGGLVVIAALLYASVVGLEPVLGRVFASIAEPIGDFRWRVWAATLRMVQEAPLLGIGLGGFQDVFARYRPAQIPQQYVVDYAHNDYLQLLAETGLVGLGVLGWALVTVTRSVLHRWAARRDPFVRGVTIGGLGALVAAAVHSTLDFGLHLPGNALLVVVLGALLPAVVALRLDPAGERVDLPAWRWALRPWARGAGVSVAATGALVGSLAVVPAGLSDWGLGRTTPVVRTLMRTPGAVAGDDLERVRHQLTRAARLDAWNPQVQTALAAVSAELAVRSWNRAGTPEGGPAPPLSLGERLATSQGFFATAYEASQQSLRARPRAAELHERLGWLLGTLERVRLAVQGSGLTPTLDPRLARVVGGAASVIPEALGHLRQAIEGDPQNAYRHRNLALFALVALPESVESRRLVAEELQRALSLEPGLLAEVVDQFASRLVDDGLIQASVPRRYPLLLDLARQLARHGRFPAALATLETAAPLATVPREQVAVRLATSRVLVQSGDAGRALAPAQVAMRLAPTDPEVYATLGEVHEAREEWTEALEAFGAAARLAETAAAERPSEYQARLAAFLGRRGERARALLVWRHILHASPDDPWVHVEVARLLEQQGEWAEAFKAYKVAEGLGPRDGGLHRAIAEAYLRHGLLREAALAYETAVRLEPANDRLRMALAQLYTRIGWRDQALAHYGAIARRSPAPTSRLQPSSGEAIPRATPGL